MTWRLGWYPWNDPGSAAQEQTEEMLAREDRWLFEERVAPEFEQEETDDGQSE